MPISVTFAVNTVTRRGETVCLVGNDQNLGAWNPSNAIQLHTTELNRWSCCVTLDSNTAYSYRYFVCKRHSKTSSADIGTGCHRGLDIVRWETHKQPRCFETGQTESLSLSDENFGDIDGILSESRGWLTDNLFEVHIRLHGNPIKLHKTNKACEKEAGYMVRCIPMDYSHSQSSQDSSASTYSDVLVSNLVCKDSHPCPQGVQGVGVGPKDFIVFRHRTSDLEREDFQLEISKHDDDGGEPRLIGSAHLVPENLPDSQQVLSIPIISPDAKCCGSVKVDVLVGRHASGMTFDMEKCDQSYWHWRDWHLTSPDGGHRGMGGSFSKPNPFKENTVASFEAAYKCGAKFIETDILVTKDMVPVIFHDFNATTAIKNTRENQSSSELHVTPIHDLTMEEIRHKKFFTSKGKEFNDEEPKLEKEHSPFPTLAEILTDVDTGLAFDLEVKYPQMCVDGEMEAEAKIDINTYVDTILKVIYEHAKDRRIFFSTFEPDVCILLRLKQSRYPVTFLSQGETKIYTNFLDFRSTTFANAMNFAVSEGILGLVLHTEVLLWDMAIIEEAKSRKLLMFVWGIHNNDPDMIDRFRKCKVDGVIYDRMDLYRPENAQNWPASSDSRGTNENNCNGNSRKKPSSFEMGGSPKKQQRY